MYEIPKKVRELNERLAQSLGRNPHGEPIYKWVYSETFMHWMRDISGYKEVFHPLDPDEDHRILLEHEVAMEQYRAAISAWDDAGEDPPVQPVLNRKGFVTMDPEYIERKMCPQFKDVWLVAHWHPPQPEHIWYKLYGSDAIWPRKGFYNQTNAWAEIGQLPTDSLTDKFIEIVRRQQSMTAQAQYEEAARKFDAIDRDADRQREDMIDDACTAFGNLPGTRSGGVSFPQPGVNYAV